jgi:hypothetical protein
VMPAQSYVEVVSATATMTYSVDVQGV